MRPLCGSIVLAVGLAADVGAATFVVNAPIDAVDAAPGDGVCASALGDCTLRAAVQEANALAGSDEIVLPAGGYGLSLPAAEGGGELVVQGGALTIRGAGASTTSIYAAGSHRVISSSAMPLELRNVTVRLGHSTGSGGAIRATDLRLDGVVVSDSEAVDWGGGIRMDSGVLIDTTVRDNRAGSGGGGVYSADTLSMTRSTVVDNESPQGLGGGVHCVGSGATITESTIGDNVAYDGGGLANRSDTMTLVRSTVRDNYATHYGGGLLNYGTLALENSTVSGNVAGAPAIGGHGAGIYNSAQSGADGILRMRNVTLAANDVTGPAGGGGASVYSYGGTVTFGHTILASEEDGDCAGAGSFVSEGHNLEFGDTCALTAAGDQPDVFPLLDGLAPGPGDATATHRPTTGSAAIDAGDPQGCRDRHDVPLAIDQRGVSRPRDGDGNGLAVCDIGAVEVPEPDAAALLFAACAALAVVARRRVRTGRASAVAGLVLALATGEARAASLAPGTLWEWGWIYTSRACSAYGCSSDRERGRYRITLGAPQTIQGVVAYEIEASGQPPKFAPTWQSLAASGTRLYASSDGAKLELLYDSAANAWPATGLLEPFPEALALAQVGHIDNDWIEMDATKVVVSASSSQCQYFPDHGTICGLDEATSYVKQEFYTPALGLVGTHFDSATSDCGGGFCTEVTLVRNVGLIATSLRGDPIDHELETEPDPLADPMPLDPRWYQVIGFVSETDLFDTLNLTVQSGTVAVKLHDWFDVQVASRSDACIELTWTKRLPDDITADLDLAVFGVGGYPIGLQQLGFSYADNRASGVQSESVSLSLSAQPPYFGHYQIGISGFDTPAGAIEYTLAVVPEPGANVLPAAALLALGGLRRARTRAHACGIVSPCAPRDPVSTNAC